MRRVLPAYVMRANSEMAARLVCICDGKKHWRIVDGDKVLRTNWKTNPYCKAHENETKKFDDR